MLLVVRFWCNFWRQINVFGDLGGSIHKHHELQQQHSTAQLSPPSSQRPAQLQKAARCRLNPQQARSSIIAQQRWRRWAASRTRDRAPCLYDDRAHQHAQANIDQQQSNSNNTATTKSTQLLQYSSTARRPPLFQTPSPIITVQPAGDKRSNDGYHPCPARCAAAVLFYAPSKAHRSKGVVVFAF